MKCEHFQETVISWKTWSLILIFFSLVFSCVFLSVFFASLCITWLICFHSSTSLHKMFYKCSNGFFWNWTLEKLLFGGNWKKLQFETSSTFFDRNRGRSQGRVHMTMLQWMYLTLKQWWFGGFFSVDVDRLDPAFAPGVSHIEPRGLSFRDVLNILHNLLRVQPTTWHCWWDDCNGCC